VGQLLGLPPTAICERVVAAAEIAEFWIRQRLGMAYQKEADKGWGHTRSPNPWQALTP
jgi:hypothetical protein